jgi:hypothetical protein
MPSYFTTYLGVTVDLLSICNIAFIAAFEFEKYNSFVLAMSKEIALFSPALTSLPTSLSSILAFFLKLFNIIITNISFINERYFPVLEVNRSRI